MSLGWDVNGFGGGNLGRGGDSAAFVDASRSIPNEAMVLDMFSGLCCLGVNWLLFLGMMSRVGKLKSPLVFGMYTSLDNNLVYYVFI
jgi:hypothetical protein